MAYINNVLYYIDLNLKRSSEDKLIEVCKLLFQEKEIIEAKQYLIETCQPVLSRINKPLSEDVKKGRKNSDDRSKIDVSIKDIIKILECFMGNEQKLEIVAKNPESIPKVQPESVNMVSIMTKLQEIDTTFLKITKENSKAKCEFNCVEIKEENALLKNRIIEMEKLVENMNKMFSSKQVQHVLPEAEATSVPNDKVDLSSPPEGIVNSNQNVGLAPIPDTFAHANENENDKASNDNVPLHDVQNKETVRESDVEVISNNLATLVITSDTSPPLVSETGANPDSEETSSTVLQEGNVPNNEQNVEDANIGNNIHGNSKNKQSSRPKSKGSILHERNILKTQEAIAASNKAIRNGATDDEANAIGMEAATAVCKSYVDILNRSHNNSKAKTKNKNNSSAKSKTIAKPKLTIKTIVQPKAKVINLDQIILVNIKKVNVSHHQLALQLREQNI